MRVNRFCVFCFNLFRDLSTLQKVRRHPRLPSQRTRRIEWRSTISTAVENNAGFEYGGKQGFEYGGSYSNRLLASRGIPASPVKAAVARGHGTSAGAGKTLYSDYWTARSGKRWHLFVITLGGAIVTSWVEQG